MCLNYNGAQKTGLTNIMAALMLLLLVCDYGLLFQPNLNVLMVVDVVAACLYENWLEVSLLSVCPNFGSFLLFDSASSAVCKLLLFLLHMHIDGFILFCLIQQLSVSFVMLSFFCLSFYISLLFFIVSSFSFKIILWIPIVTDLKDFFLEMSLFQMIYFFIFIFHVFFILDITQLFYCGLSILIDNFATRTPTTTLFQFD